MLEASEKSMELDPWREPTLHLSLTTSTVAEMQRLILQVLSRLTTSLAGFTSTSMQSLSFRYIQVCGAEDSYTRRPQPCQVDHASLILE